ncbi:hypothetical protein SUGI_0971890 [Cryptomeria japonica]|nr:hypothetical protein SUGI_0971890 [Cryptomeria japonica]
MESERVRGSSARVSGGGVGDVHTKEADGDDGDGDGGQDVTCPYLFSLRGSMLLPACVVASLRLLGPMLGLCSLLGLES